MHLSASARRGVVVTEIVKHGLPTILIGMNGGSPISVISRRVEKGVLQLE